MLWYVINRSFICGKLEQAIRIVNMQYSVHTIKIKEIQNWYKTKLEKKILQLKRYSGKALCSLDYGLYSVPNRTYHTYQNNTDILVMGVFKKVINIGFYSTMTRRSPGGGHGKPLHYSCLGNPRGQRSLEGYSPWGCKESDTTERLSTAHITI